MLLLVAPAALAVTSPTERLDDPALEERARELSKELRCVVCQNQSIDDSNAPLARDLRLLVRERLAAGDSDPEVLSFVTARYGDFVLLKPPVRSSTWVLWYGPLIIVILGAIGIGFWMRRQRRTQVVAPLSAEESEELARLLKERS
jgi:cytochrome c-type biogenesis protein CcmH